MPRIALISDAHDLLRPEALAFLAGADHIVQGGDIGGSEILARLTAIATLSVVRGNNDSAPWATDIPVARRWCWAASRCVRCMTSPT